MPDIRNDEPINSVVNDEFGFSFQASVIAKLVGGENSKNHLSVGVSGSWGSGKTSLLNMVRELLNIHNFRIEKNKIEKAMNSPWVSPSQKEKSEERLNQINTFFDHIKKYPNNFSELEEKITEPVKVIWFDPWFFGSEETVIKAFFYRIAKELVDEDRELSKLFLKLAVVMVGSPDLPESSSLPVVGDAFKIINFGRNLINRMSGDDGSIMDFTDIKNKISAKLEETNKRIVIIIDDLDRLQVDEALTMLKVIRLVTEFGVNFVIGYDEETLSATIDKNCGGHGREYIRKMINTPISISAISDGDFHLYLENHLQPKTLLSDLCMIYIDRYKAVFGYLKQDEHKQERVDYNVDSLPPSLEILIKTLFFLPREIVNLSNIFNIYIHTLDTDVDELDFLILCVMKIKFPSLFNLMHDKLWPFRISQNYDEIEYIKEQEKIIFEKTTKHDINTDDITEKSVKRSLYNDYYNLFVDATSEGLFSSIVHFLLFNKADNALKKASNWRLYFCFLPKDYEDNEKSLENLYNSPIGLLNDPIYRNGLHFKAK